MRAGYPFCECPLLHQAPLLSRAVFFPLRCQPYHFGRKRDFNRETGKCPENVSTHLTSDGPYNGLDSQQPIKFLRF